MPLAPAGYRQKSADYQIGHSPLPGARHGTTYLSLPAKCAAPIWADAPCQSMPVRVFVSFSRVSMYLG